MRGQKRLGLAVLAMALGCIIGTIPATGKETHQTQPVRIGLVSSLFRDTPDQVVMAVVQPFAGLIEAQTGISAKLVVGGEAMPLAQQLEDDKVDLGIFHGIEFAWAKHKHPDLQPLMMAVNQQKYLRAFLLVRKDNPAKGFGDFKGKTLAIPFGTKEHCRVFMQRRCQASGNDPAHLFAKITKPSNCEEALDSVVDGEIEAILVDGVALDCFKRRKPGRAAKLRAFQESEVFPAGVVAYHPGQMDDEVLQRFRTGLMDAPNTSTGRQLMTLWKLTSFEPIPDDYQTLLEDIVKVYPPPPDDAK